MSEALQIDRFRTWHQRARRAARPRLDLVCLGSEYDIAHICRLWQRVMTYRIDCMPENTNILWCLSDVLTSGYRDPAVHRDSGMVSIARRHVSEFRTQIDWLWDHLCDEHADDLYELVDQEWQRVEGAAAPIVRLEDSQRAIEIIDALYESWADNVVKIREDA
jgi:hypothetical protein